MTQSPLQLFRNFATPSSGARVDGAVADADRYASFFRDLDSYTQYSQFYRPELNGVYMDLVINVLFPGPIDAWEQFVRDEMTPRAPASLTRLQNAIAAPAATDALKQIDDLLRSLLHAHFPGSGSSEFDLDAYVRAVEAFARDLLPVDEDRLRRVGGGGDDVSHHRMDDPSMWFKWGAAVDCAAMLDGDGGLTPSRVAYLGAAAFGSAMDCTFRARGKTRPEYHSDAATETLLRNDVRVWVRDPALARAQVRDLYRVFTSD
jgi:hypothetical protein